MYSRFRLILFFLLFLSAPALYAQVPDTTVIEDYDSTITVLADETVTANAADTEVAAPIVYNTQLPTNTQWQTVTSDKAFDYKNQVEYVPEPEKPAEKPSALFKILMRLIAFLFSTVGKILLLVLLIGIVGYVLYRILAGEGKSIFGRNSKTMEPTTDAVVSEEDLLTSNWNSQLQKALHDGDMRTAIRYSYMMLLQMLQSQDLIQYRQDKTNTAYYRELSDTNYGPVFRHLSRQYEATWYGAYLPTPEAFNEYMQAFNGIKNKIGNR